MNKIKKVLSLVLALTLVLGSFGSVFAADVSAENELKKVPSDVVGTEYEKAVSKLVSFSVLNGYPDGTFKPENNVTRAEFAKILVEALGVGNAAEAAKGKTKFADVNAGGYDWARGYINVAVGQGLLKGYPDGTFKPEAQVTYAESLTMLVRALGYKDEFLSGSWPGNYIAKAADTGITSGIRFADASGSANRGRVAQLVSNAFDAKVVKVKTFIDGKTEYYESDATLLKEKLDISKYEDTRIVADKLVEDGLDKDEVTVDFMKKLNDRDKDAVKKDYGVGKKDLRFRNSANPRAFIGEEVTVYIDDSEKIVHIESEKDDKAHFDYVEEIKSGNGVTLVKFDKDYKIDKDARVYLHDGKDKFVDRGYSVDTKDLLGKSGKFVVKNNAIVYAEVLTSSEALHGMVVLENEKGLLEGINQTTEDFDLDLRKDGSYDGVLVYDTEGKVLSLDDIKEGNVVYVQKQDYDGDDYALVVVVRDNVVKGELTKVEADNVTLDGKMVKIARFKDNGNQYQSYYSVEGLEDVKVWNDKNDDWENDMEDADVEEMVAYLDAVGKIVFLSTEAKGTSGYKYGVVTRIYADNDRVKIYTTIDGEKDNETVYKAAEDKDIKSPKVLDELGNYDKSAAAVSLTDGSVVKFKLNKDGEIADGELYVMNPKNSWKMQAKKDFGKDSIPVTNGSTNKSFFIDDKSVIIDAEGLDAGKSGFDSDDFRIAKWKDIAEDNYDEDLEFFVFTKRSNDVDIDAVIFAGKEGLSTSSDEEAIYVVDKWTKGGDTYVKYVSYDTGKIEEKEVNKLDDKTNVKLGDVAKERPYIAKVETGSKVDLLTEATGDLSFVEGVVKSKDDNVITVGAREYRLSGNTVVYEEDVKKSTSNIRKGDAVLFVVENKVNVRVIERLIDSEAQKVIDKEDGKVDFTELDKAITEGNDAVKEGKTAVSVRALEDAIKVGKAVRGNEKSTPKEVADAAKAIRDAVKRLEEEDPNKKTIEAKLTEKVFGSFVTITNDKGEDLTKVVLNGDVVSADDYTIEGTTVEIFGAKDNIKATDKIVVTIGGVDYELVIK